MYFKFLIVQPPWNVEHHPFAQAPAHRAQLGFSPRPPCRHWPALEALVSQALPKRFLALCTSLIVSLTDYEELPDDSSISFLSLPGAPFFSLAFSQGHDSISHCGNVHGGYWSFNHCILMQCKPVTDMSRFQAFKKVIKEYFINSNVLSIESKLKLGIGIWY